MSVNIDDIDSSRSLGFDHGCCQAKD